MFGKKVYLGGKTYAHYTGDGIALTKIDGVSPRQEIFLDNDMINALDKFKSLILHWLNVQEAKKNEQVQS